MAYDQRIADRVVGVFGTSSRAHKGRDFRRVKIDLGEELEGTGRDDGHFMAHSIGGGLDVNLFSQGQPVKPGLVGTGEDP